VTWRKFEKSERSTFTYWFWHWLAFNYTAFKLKAWKPKYLFHDIEKPWLKLFLDYPKVQKWHRTHNAHHLEYRKPYNRNWIDMAIDWECSGLTKVACPRDAMGEADFKRSRNEMTDEEYLRFKFACEKLNLIHNNGTK
jgi:hypothetical protein